MVLIGTNILLRILEPNDPEHTLVREAVKALTARGESLRFASQSLIEFWTWSSVMSNSTRNTGRTLATCARSSAPV